VRRRWPSWPRHPQIGALIAIGAVRRPVVAVSASPTIADQAPGRALARRGTAGGRRGTDTAQIPVRRDEADRAGPTPDRDRAIGLGKIVALVRVPQVAQ
jgi:hypothetical protein